ncbi:helix-turn-helix transcriptional regulator [Leptolyngbya sp. FACHB-541]|uniref:helix-turn-helix domain-containing protein n=1 Tax=Leptolyngbya sp. FACHB-541 TaxID=2692810 RepID=UPI001686E40E|nr:helix-turn-helix transcriptional regulator [Leptolyngbya sp. FACHB-541]MBD1998050.1 helix-turn-helix transcriptional regulator [Leptolyngbya sp. FACHB-541]
MRRSPSRRQWELFQLYSTCPPPLHPMVFTQFWEVSYKELETLTGASLSTIEHWFSGGRSRREPSDAICRRLAEIHLLWSNSDRIKPSLIQNWCRLQKQ